MPYFTTLKMGRRRRIFFIISLTLVIFYIEYFLLYLYLTNQNSEIMNVKIVTCLLPIIILGGIGLLAVLIHNRKKINQYFQRFHPYKSMAYRLAILVAIVAIPIVFNFQIVDCHTGEVLTLEEAKDCDCEILTASN